MSVQPSLTLEQRLAAVNAMRVLQRTHAQRAIARELTVSQSAITRAVRGIIGADVAKSLVNYFKLDSLDDLVIRFGAGSGADAPPVVVGRAADDPFPERALAVLAAQKRGVSPAATRMVMQDPEFQLPHLRFKPAYWWSTTIDELDTVFRRTVPKTDEELEAFAATHEQQKKRKKRLAAAAVKSAESPPSHSPVARSKAR